MAAAAPSGYPAMVGLKSLLQESRKMIQKRTRTPPGGFLSRSFCLGKPRRMETNGVEQKVHFSSFHFPQIDTSECRIRNVYTRRRKEYKSALSRRPAHNSASQSKSSSGGETTPLFGVNFEQTSPTMAASANCSHKS